MVDSDQPSLTIDASYAAAEVLVFYTRGLMTTGPVREAPENARQLKQRLNYQCNTCEQYYSTGALMAIGEHKHGVKNGYWQNFYLNGNRLSRGTYHDGVRHGDWHSYHRNGKMMTHGPYANGAKQGHWRNYNENGVMIAEGPYIQNAKQGRWREYNDRGELTGEGDYDANQKTGFWAEYNSRGLDYGAYHCSKRQGHWLVNRKSLLLFDEQAFKTRLRKPAIGDRLQIDAQDADACLKPSAAALNQARRPWYNGISPN